MAQAEIKTKLTADGSELTRALSQGIRKAADFRTQMQGIGRSIGAAFTVGSFVQLGRMILNDTDRIQELASNLGMTTDALQAFESVAITSGVNSEQLAGVLEKLSVARADNADKFAESLAQIGVSAESAVGPIDELVLSIGKAFKETGNLAALKDFFGKSAARLPLFMREVGAFGSIGELISDAKSKGQIVAAAEIEKGGAAKDAGIALLNKARKAVEGGMIGASDEQNAAALAAQRDQISLELAQRRKIQADRKAEERAAKQKELENVIASAKAQDGIGNQLVKIGARGGMAGREDEKVALARKQLKALENIETNTSENQMPAGVFVP